MKKNLTLIILITVFLVLSVILVILIKTGKIKNFAATNNATLALSPASGNYVVGGSNFSVNILVNTGGQATYATEVYLNYDPTALQVIDADSGTAGVQIQSGGLYSQVTYNSVNTTTGKIIFMASVNGGETPYTNSSSATLATITFKALKVVNPTQVTFDFFSVGATNDSNVLLAGSTGTDILGSVTNGSYTLVPPDISTTVKVQLEGRSNASSTNTTLEVRSTGQTPIVFQNNSLTTDATGTATLTISGVPAGNYDFKIKVNHWLYKSITNQPLISPLTLNFGTLLGGDINPAVGDNQINGGDFTYLKQQLTTNDPIADINQDGTVNMADFGVIYKNWGSTGQ